MKTAFVVLLSLTLLAGVVSCSQEAGKGESATQSATNVIDYGMGATQLKTKKNAEQKIQQLQQQHNQQLNDALAE